MALREITGNKDQVTINGSNQIYGGYIFNGSVSFGFSNTKTTISISVVSENGNYLVPTQDLDTSDPQVIQFGENIVIDPAFLYEYSIEKRGDSRILQLTYVDGSILLDKIFVGLNYQHGFEQEDEQEKYLEAEFKCHPCPGPSTERRTVTADENGLLKDGVRYSAIISKSREAKSDQKTINKWKGGYLILGDENYEPNTCKIPNVSYNFTQLKNLLEVNDIKLENLTDVNPDYSQTYVGTLREVLNNWCSDFGYSFYWNSLKNLNTATSTDADIIGLDLSFPISLTNTKNSLEAIDANSNNETVITSLSEKYSLENTKKVYHLSSFKRESSLETRPWTLYKAYTATAVTLQDLAPNGDILLGRTYSQFIISCVLSKYNENLRDIYNMQLYRNSIVTRASTADGFSRITSSTINPKVLGYERIYGAFFQTLSGKKQEEFFNSNNVFAKGLNDKNKVNFPYVIGAFSLSDKQNINDYYLGFHNEDYHRDLKAYESQVADFIGKYYKVPSYWEPFDYCSYEESYKLDVSTVPSSEIYNPYNDSQRSGPFSQLVRESVSSNVIGSNNRVFERAATYGLSSERLDEILNFNDNLTSIGTSDSHEQHDTISTFDVESLDVTDAVLDELGLSSDIVDNIVEKEGKSLKILRSIKKDILNYIIRISDLYTTQNTQEAWSSTNESEDSPECKTVCEFSFLEELCRCLVDQFGNPMSYEGQELIPPYEGLLNRNALAFDVTTLLSDSTANQYYNASHRTASFRSLASNEVPIASLTRSVVLPSQSDYQIYYKLDFERKSTMPKVTEIKGSISDGQGLASIEVVAEDITNKIESYYNGSQDEIVTNVLVPGTASVVPKTTQEYHDQRVLNLSTGIGEPQHTINVSFAGLDSSYANFINPKSGLTSFNINFSEGAMNVDLEFSNRPLQLPNPDAVSKTISPRLYNLTPSTLKLTV